MKVSHGAATPAPTPCRLWPYPVEVDHALAPVMTWNSSQSSVTACTITDRETTAQTTPVRDRKVVGAVLDEDGFQAWRKLRMRFELTLTATWGIVVVESRGMVVKPATTPREFMTMMTEMDKKVWTVEVLIPPKMGTLQYRACTRGAIWWVSWTRCLGSTRRCTTVKALRSSCRW